MNDLLQFLKTTVIGGLVFLMPVIVIIVVVGKALQLSRKLAEPLAAYIPIDTIAGIALANVIGGVVLVVLCFAAGLAARSTLASAFVREAENRLLWKIPGYSLLKGLVDGISGAEGDASMRPVLIGLDDSSQLGFEIERLEDGRVVVFAPDSPDPSSGSVLVLDAGRIKPLPITMLAAVQNIRMLGRGTKAFLGVPAGEVKAKSHPETGG